MNIPFFNRSKKYPYKIGTSQKIFRVHITKTAGTSLMRALKFNRPNRKIGIRKHYFVRQIIDIEGQDAWDKAFTFTFVRNPWDRMYSLYKFKVRKGELGDVESAISFDTWLRREVVNMDGDIYNRSRPQVEWLLDHKGNIDVDFIGRFENLENDTQKLSKIINRNIALEKFNVSPKKGHYSKAYTKELADLVAQYYVEDINAFGYSFEKV